MAVLRKPDGTDIGITGEPVVVSQEGNPPLPSGAATEATLAELNTRVGDESAPAAGTVNKQLETLNAKDFATETTQATLLTEAEFEARVGEVQATPTANTILDRLKALATRIGEVQEAPTQYTLLDRLREINLISGVKKIVDALPVGDNWIGRTKVGDGTNVAAIHDIDGIKHIAAGMVNGVDDNNSSTSQLASGGTFIGAATDVSQYAAVATTLHSDQASAVDGMKFQFSIDGTNWDDSYNFNMGAGETRRFQFPVCARYFRIHYTNGTTTTTEFRCQTILNRQNILTSIHRVENVVSTDRSAQVQKSVIIAQREGLANTNFYPVQADVAGNLKVTTIGADIPSDPSAFVLEYLENGGSESMLVNGSVTPVTFSLGPTVTDEQWSIRELLLVFTADDFSFDGASFGPNAALTNGIDIVVYKDSVATEVFRIFQNEDWLRVPGRLPLVNNTGPKDVLGSALVFDGLILSQASGDEVRMTVRDNLTSTKLKYLTASLFASKVE
jgi:hypothetical protein